MRVDDCSGISFLHRMTHDCERTNCSQLVLVLEVVQVSELD